MRSSPRIYVYDLPVRWRCGPQLLSELDMALLERLLLSTHREVDGERADYFWLPGPNLRPARKLAYVREAWPYWNRTAKAGLRRHLVLQPCDNGPDRCLWESKWFYQGARETRWSLPAAIDPSNTRQRMVGFLRPEEGRPKNFLE